MRSNSDIHPAEAKTIERSLINKVDDVRLAATAVQRREQCRAARRVGFQALALLAREWPFSKALREWFTAEANGYEDWVA